MKRLFRKKSSGEDFSPERVLATRTRSYSFPLENTYEVLHSPRGTSFPSTPLLSGNVFAFSGNHRPYNDPDQVVDPLSADVQSVALSEAETLFEEKRTRLHLQETYLDNFTHYLPFLLLRQRFASTEYSLDDATSPSEQEPASNNHGVINGDAGLTFDSGDDLPTMIDEPIEENDTTDSEDKILTKSLRNFTVKRECILASELFKGNSYVFPSMESFQLFRQLRSNLKKSRKSSTYLYDRGGSIKMQPSRSRSSVDDGDIIDERQHLIPLNYKIKGQGLPLLKFYVPYMQSFRRSTPFIIFKRFKEIPEPPENNEKMDLNLENDFETYTYCTVNTKYSQDLRRYIFNFTPAGQEEFQILVFQHNMKPFADFNYKDTRFRVVGTTLATGYLASYSPRMKLMVIDSNKPSLCDKVIERKGGFELRSIMKKKTTTPKSEPQYSGLRNPFPEPSCPLLDDNHLDFAIAHSQTARYVPRSKPPFGAFQDSIVYDVTPTLLPKKYSESGKFEVYQDGLSLPDQDIDSTLSVDTDVLVLNCILLSLREAGIRSANRGATNSVGLSPGLRMLSGFAGAAN